MRSSKVNSVRIGQKRAVIYARVSGDDRAKEGRNLQSQIEDGRAYCQEKGYRVVKELSEDDKGASGADWDLPMLNKALDMARNGEFDVLVVRELDRFARGLAKQLVVESEFKGHGVEIEYVLGEYEDTPEGQLNKNIRAVVAEYERLKIAERTRRARRNVVKNGHPMLHGNAPFGYRLEEDGTLAISEGEAAIVKKVFDLYVNEELSISAVAERMTGTPTCADLRQSPSNPKRRKYGRWSAGSVSNILRNETYAGIWTYAGDLTVAVPAIVDRGTWEKARARCSHNRKFARKNPGHDYLMAGRLTCGDCGSAMICRSCHDGRNKDRVYFYYYCPASRLYATKCEMTRHWPANQVDWAIWEWLHSLLLEPEQMAERLRKRQAEQEQASQPLRERLATTNGLLAQYEQELENIIGLGLEGKKAREIVAREADRLEAIIASLEAKLAKLTVELESAVLTDDQIQTIEDLEIEEVLELAAVDWLFEKQKEWVEKLDVRATLAIEEGRRVIHVRCHIGEEVLSISASGSRTR